MVNIAPQTAAKTGSDPPKPVPPHQFWGYLLTRTKPRLPAAPATDQSQSHQSSLVVLAHNRPDFSTQSTRPTASLPPESQCLADHISGTQNDAHLQPTIWFARSSGAALPASLHGLLCRFPPQKGLTTIRQHRIVRLKTRSNQTFTSRGQTTGVQCQDIGAGVSIFGFLRPMVRSTHGWFPRRERQIFQLELA